MKPLSFSAQQEAGWIRAARRRDPDAFEALVQQYEKRVYALALRMCGQEVLAQEAAQEAFLSAWQGLPSFRGDSSFSTWLYRLTVNACTDLLRREQRHRAAAGPSLDDDDAFFDAPDTAASPQEQVEQAELRRAIERDLQTLPEDYRAALILREVHQLSYAEIAAALRLDLGTVKSRISRGRRLLREYLSQTGNLSAAAPSKQKTGKEDA